MATGVGQTGTYTRHRWIALIAVSKAAQKQNKKEALHQSYRTITKHQSSEAVTQVSEPFPWQAGERQCSEGMLG